MNPPRPNGVVEDAMPVSIIVPGRPAVRAMANQLFAVDDASKKHPLVGSISKEVPFELVFVKPIIYSDEVAFCGVFIRAAASITGVDVPKTNGVPADGKK